tara:strand:+ start:463 stop:666 length:204 start_codon:yes stop_codon:yes gene_type:complete
MSRSYENLKWNNQRLVTSVRHLFNRGVHKTDDVLNSLHWMIEESTNSKRRAAIRFVKRKQASRNLAS